MRGGLKNGLRVISVSDLSFPLHLGIRADTRGK